jgi:hypothetical protein
MDGSSGLELREREREREREILFVTIYRFIPKDRNLELYVGTSYC